ncbi:MAG: hypothetical protein R2795_02215 [Saprospiraceae bacterium]
MFLQKLIYHDGTGAAMTEASKRIEFMVHYWQYVFSHQHFRLDEEWLKSHRGLLQRIKLQIETNFDSVHGCQSKVRKFFVNEPFFEPSNPVISSLSTKKKIDIDNLKRIFSKNFNQQNHADFVSADVILRYLNNIIAYFDTYYHNKLKSALLTELSRNDTITSISIANLRCLLNCLIVELLSKGFTQKYLSDLVFKIQNPELFPYDRLRGDFNTDQEYEDYKNSIFASLTIKEQINSIVNLLNREERQFEVVYKVYGINWQIEPLEILNVTFYNPTRNTKIVPFQFFNEDFTIAGGGSAKPNSLCNAFVEVNGIQEPMILDRAYTKVSAALSILNAQIEKQTYLKKDKALLAVKDRNPKVLFGSGSAINEVELINRIPEFKRDDINYINQLDWSIPKDQDLIRLISEISELMKSDSKYSLLDIYSNLEGYFGKANVLKKIFVNCFKIWSDKHYPVSVKILLINGSTSSGSRFEVNEEHQLTDSQINSQGFDTTPGRAINYVKFMNKLTQTKNIIDTPFWDWVIDDVIDFRDNRTVWNTKMKDRIEYLIDELNTERNLIVHSRQTEEYTRMRKQEFFNFILIIIQIYTSYHLSYSNRKTVTEVSNKIERKANII